MTKTNQSFNYGRHRWLGHVVRDSALPGSAHRVAVLLWEHMNAEYGYAWPSLVYIADQLGMHKSTVVRSINTLSARGWISVERRCGRHRGNRYRIAFGAPSSDTDWVSFSGRSTAPKRSQDGTETVAR